MKIWADLFPGLTGLIGACLISATADALFDDGAAGLRLVCGLTVALCAAKLMTEALSGL